MRASSLAMAMAIGCAPEGHTVSDDGPMPDQSEPSRADQDECESGSWAHLDCPAGYAPRIFFGDDDLVIVDLDDAARPVCGGRATFVDRADLDGVDHAGYLITQNTACVFGCFGPCGGDGMTAICETECHRVCGPIDEEHCVELVESCDPSADCQD